MFKIDTHVHTSEVSPCGHVGARDLVRLYKEKGYGGLIITDHFSKAAFKRLPGATWAEQTDEYLRGYHEARAAGDALGLMVFLGLEYNDFKTGNDYLVYGVTRDFLLEHERLCDNSLPEMKKILEENNMLILQAHPFRVGRLLAPPELVDGIEVFNGHFNHNSNNHLAEELGQKYGKLMLSGSDCHDIVDVGNGGIILENAPETDNPSRILTEMSYSLIKTEPQCADILVAAAENAEDAKRLSVAAKEQSMDAVVIYYKGNSSETLAKTGDNVIVVTEDSPPKKYGRCHFAAGVKHLDHIDICEPAIVFCDEINRELEEELSARSIYCAIGCRGGKAEPWQKELTYFAAFDMFGAPCALSVSIKGPMAQIEPYNI